MDDLTLRFDHPRHVARRRGRSYNSFSGARRYECFYNGFMLAVKAPSRESYGPTVDLIKEAKSVAPK